VVTDQYYQTEQVYIGAAPAWKKGDEQVMQVWFEYRKEGKRVMGGHTFMTTSGSTDVSIGRRS
jgi:hypothetical protein